MTQTEEYTAWGNSRSIWLGEDFFNNPNREEVPIAPRHPDIRVAVLTERQ
jgi:hypothetical protein